MSNSTEMLSASNRYLLAMLLRRFRCWHPADRRWLIERLSAADREAS